MDAAKILNRASKVAQLLRWMRDMVGKPEGYRKVSVPCDAELLDVIEQARDRFLDENYSTTQPEMFNLGVGSALIAMKFFRNPADQVANLYRALNDLVDAVDAEHGGQTQDSVVMKNAKLALGRAVNDYGKDSGAGLTS